MQQNILVAILLAGGVTILDWGLGILVSLKQGTFSVQKLPGQLVSMVLPYMGGLSIIGILQNLAQQAVPTAAGGTVPPITAGVSYGAVVTYGLKVLADIWNKLGVLLPTGSAPVVPPPAP